MEISEIVSRTTDSESTATDRLLNDTEEQGMLNTFLQLPKSEWPDRMGQIKPEISSEETAKESKPSRKQPKAKTNVFQSSVFASTAGKGKDRECNQEKHTQPKQENSILTHLLESCSSFSKIRRTLAYSWLWLLKL